MLSDTVFFVVDFDVVSDLDEVVIVFDVLVVSAVVTVFVVVVVSDVVLVVVVSVWEDVTAAVVVLWLTAEVSAFSSFTVFSILPQAVSMAASINISIDFFMLSSPFQQHHTTKPVPKSSLFGKLLPFGLFTQRVFLHVYQSRLSE